MTACIKLTGLERPKEFKTADQSDTVLVVAHGGCVRTVQRHLLGKPLPTLDNCGVYLVSLEEGALRLVVD